MPLPPHLRKCLQTSTEVRPDTRIPLKYRRAVAKAQGDDLAWLLAHPGERVRIRRAVLGEFWPSYLDMQGDCWVLVVMQPEYSSLAIEYDRFPLWGAHPSPFVAQPPIGRCETN